MDEDNQNSIKQQGYVVITLKDETQEKYFQEMARKKDDMYKFISKVTHDLKDPLNGILNYMNTALQVLKNGLSQSQFDLESCNTTQEAIHGQYSTQIPADTDDKKYKKSKEVTFGSNSQQSDKKEIPIQLLHNQLLVSHNLNAMHNHQHNNYINNHNNNQNNNNIGTSCASQYTSPLLINQNNNVNNQNKNLIKVIEKCYKIAKKANFFVQDIQAYSQIRFSSLSLVVKKESLSNIIYETYDILESKFKQYNNQLVIQDDKIDKDIHITTDPMRLTQILMNLISNSLKFTEQGQITLIIENNSKNDKLLDFTVQDNGKGMGDEIKNIFQAFKTNERNSDSHGVGLGLIIVKEMVNLLGPKQEIQVSSKLGQGSKFKFSIFKNLKIKGLFSLSTHQTELKFKKQDIRGSLPLQVGSRRGLSFLHRSVNKTLTEKINVKEKSMFKNTHLHSYTQKYDSQEELELSQNDEIYSNENQHTLVNIPTTFRTKQNSKMSQINVNNISHINISQSMSCIKNEEDDKILLHDQIYLNTPNNHNIQIVPKQCHFRNILLVDDEEFSLDLIEQTIKGYYTGDDISIQKALGGQNALRFLQEINEQPQIDLIIIDKNMPFIDGPQTSKKIKEINPTLPIFMCTGENQNQIVSNYDIELNSANFEKMLRKKYKQIDGILEKPLNMNQFEQLIESYLKKQQQNYKSHNNL